MSDASRLAPVNPLTVTSHYGPRKALIPGMSTNHLGTDYRAPEGTPVFAAAGGTVVKSAFHNARGNYVQIQHADKTKTLYQHLQSANVSAGDRVSAGQTIGRAGKSGNVTGAHLHFEVTVRDKNVNPHVWLANAKPKPPASNKPKPKPPTVKPASQLREGDSGARVKELQRVLNAWYPKQIKLVEDGHYGPKTEAAVNIANIRHGLPRNGVASKALLEALGLM